MISLIHITGRKHFSSSTGDVNFEMCLWLSKKSGDGELYHCRMSIDSFIMNKICSKISTRKLVGHEMQKPKPLRK